MSATVHLHVRSSSGTDKSFSLTEHDTFLLGRMKDCHLCLPDDEKVSRHHFLLEACPPMASLRDLGSMNGTHVNGKKCGGREKGETPEQGALRQYPGFILNENPVPIHDRMPGLEKNLAAVIDQALVRNPKDRFADAGKLLAALPKQRS